MLKKRRLLKPPRVKKSDHAILRVIDRLDEIQIALVDHHVHLRAIQTTLKELLMASADMKASLAKIDTATNNIAADLQRLKDQIGTGMSDADVAEVQGILDTTVAKLEAIAAENPDPAVP